MAEKGRRLGDRGARTNLAGEADLQPSTSPRQNAGTLQEEAYLRYRAVCLIWEALESGRWSPEPLVYEGLRGLLRSARRFEAMSKQEL